MHISTSLLLDQGGPRPVGLEGGLAQEFAVAVQPVGGAFRVDGLGLSGPEVGKFCLRILLQTVVVHAQGHAGLFIERGKF